MPFRQKAFTPLENALSANESLVRLKTELDAFWANSKIDSVVATDGQSPAVSAASLTGDVSMPAEWRFKPSAKSVAGSAKTISASVFGNASNAWELFTNMRESVIPARFAYVGKGAQLWKTLIQNSGAAANEPEVKLLLSIMPPLLTERRFSKGVNFVDIGPGDGAKAVEILRLAGRQGTRYLAVDFSRDIISVAQDRISACFPKILFDSYIADMERDNFLDVVRKMEKSNGRPSLFFLLGKTIGNPLNRSNFLANVVKSMSKGSTLVVGLELYDPSKIDELIKEYSDEAYLDLDLWVLRELSLVPGQNGSIKVDFDHETRDIRGRFILRSDVSVASMNPQTGKKETIVLKAGQSILFFKSHRFNRNGIFKEFLDAGLKVANIAVDSQTGVAVITARLD